MATPITIENEITLPFDSNNYPNQIRSTATYTPETEEETKKKKKLLGELEEILLDWGVKNAESSYEPIACVTRISEILEESTEDFLKRDPDPLDDRHPYRTHPESAFGNLLKILFRNDDFMNKLVISYILGRDNVELSTQSCRLLLGCIPGLASNVVFSEPDDFVPKLYQWAKNSSNETLQAYSMGLLSSALEVQDNASRYRPENTILVPIALRRLKELKSRMETERQEIKTNGSSYPYTNFSHLIKDEDSSSSNDKSFGNDSEVKEKAKKDDDIAQQPPKKRRRTKNVEKANNSLKNQARIPSFTSLQNLDNSNSKWDILQPFLIGTHKVYPLTTQMYQRLILQYLVPLGEYQDLLSLAYEGNAMDLIMYYIDLEKSQDIRLTFDALKYLTSLLVHRKFAMEFVNRGGVQALLKIPRTSLGSVGVVTSFYYISYNSDIMEIICQLDSRVVDEIVSYVLWCLEHSHESGRASASHFFSHAVYFKAILERFDQMDGPRKMYNYITTLTLIQTGFKNRDTLTEEQKHTSIQCYRNACSLFRSYTAAHLFIKLESIRRSIGSKHIGGISFPTSLLTDIPSYKSMKVNEDHIWETQLVLANILRLTNSGWKPIEELRRLGVIRTLMSVTLFPDDLTLVMARVETTVHILETISICCCLPKVQLELPTVYTYMEDDLSYFEILLSLARGEDEEGCVRLASLRVIVVCLYIHPEIFKRLDHLPIKMRSESSSSRKSGKSPSIMKNIIEKIWSDIRKCDGLMALLDIIETKVPLTDADNLRTFACKALSGLAKCEEVRQILTEMPLIANNCLQSLMREPVAQDKRCEHDRFCREAMHLLETVTGKSVHDHSAKDLTQEKMNKQRIVENTKIIYNERELLQLIHDHLKNLGLTSTASLLRTEADLSGGTSNRLSTSTPIKLKPLPKGSQGRLSIDSPIGLDNEPSRRNLSSTNAMFASTSTGDDSVFLTPRAKSIKREGGSNAFPRRLYSPMRQKSQTEQPRPYRALDDILTEYFRQQHSQCANPVSICPPFSLLQPHRCPEPSVSRIVSTNIARRISMYDIVPRPQQMMFNWQDERFAYARFRPFRMLHQQEEMYTASAFEIGDENIIVGLFTGELHIINVDTAAENSIVTCHNTAITNIEPSFDGRMILTSSSFLKPLSALWRYDGGMTAMNFFEEETWVKFSNLTLDHIVGTNKGKATVYDTETNHPLMTFETGQTNYFKNIASFSPDDHLVFSDGYLYDVRAPPNALHRFDKLSSVVQNGVFHPHGNEIIINTEVFDVRNYRLLQHIPSLNQCRLSFNSSGRIMYASIWEDPEHEPFHDFVSSSFHTFDTSDYSVITTMEIKKPVIGLTTSHNDQMMAIIEKLRATQSEYQQSSSQVRILEIGAEKDAEDDGPEGDEEEEEDDESDSRTNSDSSYSDGSDDEEGVFEAIGRVLENDLEDLEDVESDSFSSEESDMFDDDEDDDDESSRSSWITASDEDDNNDEENDQN